MYRCVHWCTGDYKLSLASRRIMIRMSIEMSVPEFEELMNHLLMWGWPKEEE